MTRLKHREESLGRRIITDGKLYYPPKVIKGLNHQEVFIDLLFCHFSEQLITGIYFIFDLEALRLLIYVKNTLN